MIILTKRIINRKLPEYKEAKQLYHTAFPKEELIPWNWLVFQSRKQFIEFIAFYDNDQFVGFAYMISHKELTYLFYLAVDDKTRGQGYGSQILQDLFKMYDGRRICLSVERPDPQAKNNLQRESRIRFYERNGFVMTDKVALEKGVEYAMLSHGGDFSKDEYIALIAYFAGIFSKVFTTKFID